jgi:hypothetical protein
MRQERALKVVMVLVGLLFLRWRLSIDADGEARPCFSDDDVSLCDPWRFSTARLAQPLGAPQPDRLYGVVEFCSPRCYSQLTR